MFRHKTVLILFILFLSFLAHPIEHFSASETSSIRVTDIAEGYIKGTATEDGQLVIFQNGIRVGKGSVFNHAFDIKFSEKIKPSELNIKFFGESTYQNLDVNYQPVLKIDPISDSERVIKGHAHPGSKVSAYGNGQAFALSKSDSHTGAFEFNLSSYLKAGMLITVTSEINGVKSYKEVKVYKGLPPVKPKLNQISNLDTVITGQAEKGTTVYIKVSNQKTYTLAVNDSNSFRISLDGGKALAEGTKVTAYAENGVGRRSESTTLTVIDKIPPPAPKLNSVTDKSFSLSGNSEPGTTLYINKNAVHYKTIKANSYGHFSLPIPLQSSGTYFDVYTYDQNKNKSPVSRVVVSSQTRTSSKLLFAPIVSQMPELNRGCEVTSLSMLLGSAGISSNKMTLALQVKKDPTPYRRAGGKIYFGNPNYGFVGDIYSFSNPGFGVFNGPIEELATQYLPGRIENLSGQSFDSVLNYVSAGHPVWVITTSWFKHVPSQYWQTWHTPQGTISITMKEHSVLITGYDSKYVYFNDPLDGKKNKAKPMKEFIEGWKQYGSQAISYY
ncbi:C39 family peptidase [Bacillus sp. ISL-37]|uniref:C39 family peptidase n=1 Tax=Bacillus sp. ISL-37 TaxID=2819123 RepID=UPI001BE59474|nr:C39 family peptidase [Bacillus sp. ISL-37]MBT2686008.1 C39 family peptidase [Bacillus sp. ISL-37]